VGKLRVFSWSVLSLHVCESFSFFRRHRGAGCDAFLFFNAERPAPTPGATVSTGSASIQQSPAATSTARSTGDLIPAVIGIPPDPGASGVHRIAAGDVLAVDVFQVDELSTEERVVTAAAS
jgi:hypothetical protein